MRRLGDLAPCCADRLARFYRPTAERCGQTDVLSVVRKSQNSSGGFYRSRQRSTHDRCRANAIRFLMSAPLALPAPLLIHARRQTPFCSFLDALDYVAVSVSSAMLAWAIWVVPVVAGGQSTSENLALACVSCSLRKGARLVTVDPYTGKEVVLFDPRRDAWRMHFR